jgi:hypothetical protein
VSDYDEGGILPPPSLANWKILFWVVLGSFDDGAPRFDTRADAKAFADEWGGDVYPVVDVEVTEVAE